MWETVKNLCAIIVVAYLIASNPQALVKMTQWVTKIVYNTSVVVVKVVEKAGEEAKDISANDFNQEVPRPTPRSTPATKKSTAPTTTTTGQKLSYAEWMKIHLEEVNGTK